MKREDVMINTLEDSENERFSRRLAVWVIGETTPHFYEKVDVIESVDFLMILEEGNAMRGINKSRIECLRITMMEGGESNV